MYKKNFARRTCSKISWARKKNISIFQLSIFRLLFIDFSLHFIYYRFSDHQLSFFRLCLSLLSFLLFITIFSIVDYSVTDFSIINRLSSLWLLRFVSSFQTFIYTYTQYLLQSIFIVFVKELKDRAFAKAKNSACDVWRRSSFQNLSKNSSVFYRYKDGSASVVIYKFYYFQVWFMKGWTLSIFEKLKTEISVKVLKKIPKSLYQNCFEDWKN